MKPESERKKKQQQQQATKVGKRGRSLAGVILVGCFLTPTIKSSLLSCLFVIVVVVVVVTL